MRIANRSEFVAVVSAAIVDSCKTEMKPLWMITISPEPELFGKLRIRHNVSDIKIRNRSKVIDDVFEHWFTRYVEKRFRPCQSKWIKTSCIAGGQNDQFHTVFFWVSQ